jgi:hypothetical protein
MKGAGRFIDESDDMESLTQANYRNASIEVQPVPPKPLTRSNQAGYENGERKGSVSGPDIRQCGMMSPVMFRGE